MTDVQLDILASGLALVELAREDALVSVERLDRALNNLLEPSRSDLATARRAAWSAEHRLADAVTMMKAIVEKEV